MNENLLLSTKEAAKRLGLSQDHVRRLLTKGRIQGQKIGNSWVVLDLNYQRKRKPKYSKKEK
ncbi:helix-turn-helix domain-containing protein [Chloroflexota bacterium]